MIEVRGLVKRYGSRLAVDHLSFTVPDGQIFGFLGPNGAGKSTTMNLMTGYLGPTEGEVLIDGHSITQEPEKAKAAMGYLPEQPPLYPDMTVEEYLLFAARLKKVPRDQREDQLDRVTEMTGTDGVRERLIRNLSKGYRQRVGLAQALLGFPKVLILDEPTVGLDPKQILEMRQLIRQRAREHTVILSSHILSEVQEVCDHLLIIHHGRKVAAGARRSWSAPWPGPPPWRSPSSPTGNGAAPCSLPCPAWPPSPPCPAGRRGPCASAWSPRRGSTCVWRCFPPVLSSRYPYWSCAGTP